MGLLGIVKARMNQPTEAAHWFAKVVELEPRDAAAQSNLGNALQTLGRLEEALSCYERAIAINPGAAIAHLNRGAVLQALGRNEEALASYDLSLKLDAESAKACNNRGNVLYRIGRFEQALADFDRAIGIDPSLADAYYNRGNVLVELGRPEEALGNYREAIALGVDLEDAYLNCGAVLQKLGRATEALVILEVALQRNPTSLQAINNRGNVLFELDRHEEALGQYDRAIEIDPNHAESHFHRGNVFKAMRQPEDAMLAYGRAIALKADYAEAFLNRGVLFNELGRLDEAAADFEQALQIKPAYAEAWQNLGIVHQNTMRLDQARACYDRAIEIRPDYVEAHNNRALLNLALGHFAAGWEEFEWRWKTDNLRAQVPREMAPPWSGEALEGELLVNGEQGVGDEIFYAGMLPELASRVREIVVRVDPRLLPLMRRSFERITWKSALDPVGETTFAAQVSMGSLGRFLHRGDGVAVGPRAAGYLRASTRRTGQLREQLSPGARKICGISWISKNRSIGTNKSMQLVDLAPVFALPDFGFVDLQYGDTSAERAQLLGQMGRTLQKLDEIDNFNDLDGLAALICACDVVVTVSNTTAHLAAALGRPVLLMLPFAPGLLWYWHVDREDSPWYPTAKLYRQHRAGDWSDVIRRICADLDKAGDFRQRSSS